MRIILPDGTTYGLDEGVLPPPPTTNDEPVPVDNLPEGWEPTENDNPAIVLGDNIFEDRGTSLGQTNMTVKYGTYDPERGRVSPYSQITVDMSKYDFAWFNWIIDINGQRNAENMLIDGDGFFDLASKWGMTVMPCGTNLVNGTREIIQSGSRYWILQTLEFDRPPVKIDGKWYHKGIHLTPETSPHLFFHRINRVVYNDKSLWSTSTGINYAVDKGGTEEQPLGGKGDEYWGAGSNAIAALPRPKLWLYPKPPFDITLYKESLLVDGKIYERSNGIAITVVKYRFTDTTTYVQSQDGRWWKWEEMLVRGSSDNRSAFGTALDWRVYGTKRLDGGRRSCRSPKIGWHR